MFHIDMTFEDMRIVANSDHGFTYDTKFHDNLTGESRSINLSAEQLSFVMQINLHLDGERDGCDKMYDELEPLFKDFPNNLRPIP